MLLFVCFSISPPHVALAAPEINVSAFIVGAADGSLVNGDYDIRFALYTENRSSPGDSENAGKVWEEVQKVSIKNGMIKATLGSQTAFPSNLNLTKNQYFLGIKIGENSEMIPRKKISASPFSLSAINAETLNGATVGTQSGNIPAIGTGGKIDIGLLPTGKGNNQLVLGSDSRLDDTAVSLSVSGSYKYLSVSGEKITTKQITLGTDTTGSLTLSQGGTGLTSISAGDMLYYSSGSAFSRISVGSDGQVLTLQNGVPAWLAASAATSYSASGNLLQLVGTAFSVKAGTLTEGRICAYVTGTGLVCDTELSGATYSAGSGLTLSSTTFKLGGTISENTNLNLYSSANYDLRYYNSNSSSEMLFLDSSAGYVGIGTTSPGTKLDVSGVITATGGTSTNWNTAYTNRVDTWNAPLAFLTNAASLNYNATNFQLTLGALNTIQDIATTASPTFATLNLTTLDLGTNTISDGSMTGNWNFNSGALSGVTTLNMSNQLTSTVVTGTAPFIVASTTLNTNLNADFLDSHDTAYFQTALTNPVTGTGATNYLPKFTGASAIGNSLVYDTGTYVGIGTTNPTQLLTVYSALQNQANLTIEGSYNGSNTPTLILQRTRNAGSLTNWDWAGEVAFSGLNSGAAYTYFSQIQGGPTNVSAGLEDGFLELMVKRDGADIKALDLYDYETVFNEDSQDIDFRIESDNSASALFVQGSDGYVGIGTTSPTYKLDVQGGYANASSGFCIGGTCIGSWGDGGVGQTYSAGSGLTLSSTTFKLGGTISENTNLNLYSSANYDLRYYNSNSSSEMLFLDSSAGYVGIGTTNPSHLLAVNGNIGLGISGYLNFGTTDGTGGYGIRDNAGIIEYKNSGGAWTAFNAGSNQLYTNSGSVAAGSYLDVVHGQNTEDVIADAWISNGTVWQNVGTLSSNNDATTEDSLDMDIVDESKFDLDDLAYSTTLTPSAVSGEVTLTLGSGNWNDNAKVKKGMKIAGNGGEATINADPAAQSTITAYVSTSFSNTNAIASGDWEMTGQQMRSYNSLEQLVLNDFKSSQDEGKQIKTGALTYSAVSAVQISTNKILVAYRDDSNSSKGTAMVATISGTTVSYGTPVIFDSNAISYISVASIGTDKAIIAYYDSTSTDGQAIVASVSGTVISFGSEVTFDANVMAYISVAQLTTDKAIIAYYDGTSTDGQAIVASVSGTTISYGTEVTFDANVIQYISVAQLDTDKALIAYNDSTDVDGQARVASVSGTTVTLGTVANFNNINPISYISAAQLTTDKVIIAHFNNSYGYAVVASVSGTTITYGTENIFNGAITIDISVAPLGTDKAIIAYSSDNTNYYARAVVASVSGTSISYGSASTYVSTTMNSNNFYIAAKADTNVGFVAAGDTALSSGRVASVSGTTITMGPDGPMGYAYQAAGGYYSAAQISSDKVLIAYRTYGGFSNGSAVVATISGTTVTYGVPVVFSTGAGEVQNISIASIGTDKAIIAYADGAIDGYARVASVSGTTISYGSVVNFEGNTAYYISVAQLTTDKAIIAYYDSIASDSQARVASISGTTITYGTEATFDVNNTTYISTAQLTTDKALIAYSDSASSGLGQAIVASVSGTTITFGTEVTFNSISNTAYISATQLTTDKALITYYDPGVTDGQAIVASVSGTTISYGAEVSFSSSASSYISLSTVDSISAIVVYQSGSNFYAQNLYVNSTTVRADVETTNLGTAYAANSGALAHFRVGKLLYVNKAADNYSANIHLIKNVSSPINNYYLTTTSDQNQLNVSYWTDIDSVAATESTNGETIYYAASYDDRTIWKIYDGTDGDSGWRPIVRNNAGTWQYNSNASAGLSNVTWTSASTNTQGGAFDQAFSVGANQMTGTELNAIADAQWESSGGYASGATQKLDFAIGMNTSTGLTPTVDNISVVYEQSEYQLRVMDANTVRFYNNSAGTVSAKVEVSLSGNSAASFWSTATGGISYVGNVGIGTTLPSAQLHTTGTVRFASFGAGSLQTDANGNLSVSSDERLKNIDETFNKGLKEILNINPIVYHWNDVSGLDTENAYVGFSAQNVQESLPEAVGIDSRGYLTLSDRTILAALVNSIKEQQKQMEELEEKNQAVIDFYLALNGDALVYKDSFGNVDLGDGKIVLEEIEVENIIAQTISLINGKTSGKAVILAGSSEIEVKTPEASASVNIYITPTDRLGGRSLYIDMEKIKEGESFTVTLDGEILETDIQFNWLIIK